MTYANKYKCSVRLWRKFGWPGRVVYNEVYGAMTKNPGIYQPNTKSYRRALLSRRDWEIICHNAACQAAWASRDAAEKLAA